jgi:hypothetical protein
MSYILDWFKNPLNRLSVIIGVAGIALLLMLTQRLNKINHRQQRQIRTLEENIALTWPPPETPVTVASDEEDWEDILKKLDTKHTVFWSSRLPRIINNLPEGVWLRGIYLTTNNQPAMISDNEGWLLQPGEGFTLEGRIHSTATDEHLESISLYIQRNLAEQATTAVVNSWEFTNLQRIDEQTIAFTAHSPLE